ncbi:hypothetical protein LCGC14_0028510 [marine sediment metagenome]|uniref:Tripartite ATP-independent periplasmic transporters DctQ component domain-containing protein n=1 Tax=marine sediment metagenome TaxID=412755 RepID=A0A0F9YDK6_9ZZZZ|nr:TRAP transporter small permease subunit [Halomonas sp.]MCL5425037.1 TRAP transporter small permease subunit [Gammaproteobacteria bacterium]HDZ47158.1 TRAP transporter small permease subunit [Halomonas sp.]HEB05893.1 TRAP transporter small permease subunit [Halomonas sp.]
MRAVEYFVHGIEAVVRLFGWIAAWTCVVLVGLVAGDVLMRYVFSIGAVWLQELQWHLISPIALFGMSYLLLMGEQVRVDVFYERFPVNAQRVIEVIGGLLLLAMGLYIAWLTLPWVAQSFARNESSPNPGGLPLRWLLKSLIPFGFVLLALQGLAHALRQAFALPTRGE